MQLKVRRFNREIRKPSICRGDANHISYNQCALIEVGFGLEGIMGSMSFRLGSKPRPAPVREKKMEIKRGMGLATFIPKRFNDADIRDNGGKC